MAVERIDAPDAPTEGTPDIDLAFKTEASAVPQRHDDPEQEDDAGALAESLQDVALEPEMTAQPVPDVTTSLLVDQKVPTAVPASNSIPAACLRNNRRRNNNVTAKQPSSRPIIAAQ